MYGTLVWAQELIACDGGFSCVCLRAASLCWRSCYQTSTVHAWRSFAITQRDGMHAGWLATDLNFILIHKAYIAAFQVAFV